MKNLFRTTLVELKSNFTLARIAGMLLVVLVPLIMPMVVGKIDIQPATKHSETWGMLGEVFSQGAIYALGLRVMLLLKDSSTLDKNRTLFLTMDKKQVLFGKIFSDSLLFLASIIAISILGPVIVVYKNGGEIKIEDIQNIAMFVIAIFALYVLTSVGLRYIVSTFRGKTKWTIFTIFLSVTVVLYVVMSIVTGVVKHPGPEIQTKINNQIIYSRGEPDFYIQTFFEDQKFIFAFIPFINVTYIALVLYGQAPLWTIVPLVVESSIFIIIIWKSLSTSVKEYLCG